MFTQDEMFTQEELQAALAARTRRAGHAGEQRRAAAIAVLRSFDPAGFAASALEFAAVLPDATRRLWLGNFTRTLFLAGDPGNISVRHPPATTAADGSVCWYATAPRPHYRGLCLLLRSLRGELPADLPDTVTVTVPAAVPGAAPPAGAPGPGAPVQWRLTVDVRGLALPQYLVHLTHTLGEALITGLLRPHDRILVSHARELAPPAGGYAYLRVHRDTDAPEALRAYACLSEERTHG
ncbi:DUF6182 family protein [Streptomyces klenkii]|uniref:DUF6182 family protein n=1 Tax=Streptomyces klenkii TaxID=1420899 RepID=UPI00342C2A49